MKTVYARCLLTLVLSVFLLPEAAGQKLEKFGKDFADELARAGWTGEAGSNGVSITIRMAKIGSKGMINAVQASADLLASERKALAHVGKITITKAGWFFGAPIQPGTYHLGLIFEKRSPHWILRDAQGQVVGKKSIVIYSHGDDLSSASVSSSKGNTKINVTCGNIEFVFRFVSFEQHALLTKSLKKTRSKRVILYSDVGDDDFEKSALSDFEKTIDAQLKLYGGKLGEAPFSIYLFRYLDDYKKIDALLTDGEFAETRGFASWLTKSAYFPVRIKPLPDRFGSAGYPLEARGGFIHEMNHLVANRLRPNAIGGWTSWLAEGMAEVGTELALESIKRGEGRRYLRKSMAELWIYDEYGLLPTVEDLSSGKMDTSRTAFYILSYLFCRELVQKKLMPPIVAGHDGIRLRKHSESLIREAVAKEYGSLRSFYDSTLKKLLKKKTGPAQFKGYFDDLKQGLRVTARDGTDSRIILPMLHKNPEQFQLDVDFAFVKSKADQADIYFGYHGGRHVHQFFKIGIKPTLIKFWRFRHGIWHVLATVTYDTSLPVSSPQNLKWLSAKVTYKKVDELIKIELSNGRWASADLQGFIPLVDGRVALGSWGGTVWFKDAKLSQPKK